MSKHPDCPYCGLRSELVTGAEIYPHRRGDEWLAKKPFYCCGPCQAWVGCHPGTTNALGRLANAELRKAKSDAHAAFDPLWKKKQAQTGGGKGRARNAGYDWLADQLGIPREDCHIGMMDVDLCKRVVEVCKPYVRSAA